MQLTLRLTRCLPLALAFLGLPASIIYAQPSPKPTPDDVVRVNTELVQTAITVVDKDGHFVDGLNRDQFHLLVDGQPRQISLFDQVVAGSPKEDRLKPNAE